MPDSITAPITILANSITAAVTSPGNVVNAPVTVKSNRIFPPLNDPIADAFIADEVFDPFLFSNYAGGVWSDTCWARQFDLSGVSWESDAYNYDAMRITLIGRNCFLTAKHYTVPPGTQVAFTDKLGARWVYEVDVISDSALDPLGVYDGRVGTLTEEVSPTLPSYDIETAPTSGDWLLATRSRFSQTSHLPFSQKAMIERITHWGGSSEFPDSAGVRWYPSAPIFDGTMPAVVAARRYSANLYDSSDALFTFKDGQLKLLSTYTGISSGPFYGFPAMLAQIDAFLAAQGSARAVHAP